MWDIDRSASRGMMACRGIYIFSHEKETGNAPAHKLLELIEVLPVGDGKVMPRSFSDYESKIKTPDSVEYKRGKPKMDACDKVQLCAQAIEGGRGRMIVEKLALQFPN